MLALALDRQANMDLALATASELQPSTAPSSVEQALLSDMRARAAHLDVKRLWPIAVKQVWVLLGVSLAAGSMSLIVSAMIQADAPAHLETAASDEDIRSTAQDLADRLKREAVLRQDPLLEAIARAIEERVAEANPETTSQELETELDALIEQAQSAFGEQVPSWLNNRKMNGQMRDGVRGQTISGGPRSLDQQRGEDEFAINLEEIEQIRRNRQLEIMEADGRSPDEQDNSFASMSSGDGKPPGSAMTAEKIEPKDMQFAGRESVGAAAESGKGPADQAGGGTSGLEGDSLVKGPGGAEDMSLPEAAQEAGRRIRITLPPSADELAAATGSAPGGAGASSGVPADRTVERSTHSVGSRAALARYFGKTSE